jgi:hypothetical protein
MAWFWGKNKSDSPKLTVTPKKERSASSKVQLGSLAPPAADFVAGACVMQLAMATELSSVSKKAWSAEDADALMMASGVALDRYRELRTLLADYEKDVVSALVVPRERLKRHLDRFETTRWFEQVGTVYVLTGFARDFWSALAGGLPQKVAAQVQEIIADRGDEDLLAGVLERVLAVDTRYSSRLSLWSRRLVGDIILVCRDALSSAASQDPETDIRLEPVFTDVLAEHTKRLDRLGLTA